MWWQDQLAVLKSGQPVSYLLVLAGFVTADAVFGFSRRLAARLKMRGQDDLILLSIVILLTLQLFDGNSVLFSRNWEMVDNPSAFPARALHMFAIEFWILQGVAIASAVACSILARRGSRSASLWFGLGYLGAWGSVIWLVTDRRKAGMPVSGSARPGCSV